ncbi:MAG: efflux RND transporter periplasmic adaptor subunit [Pirellulales bacterium]
MLRFLRASLETAGLLVLSILVIGVAVIAFFATTWAGRATRSKAPLSIEATGYRVPVNVVAAAPETVEVVQEYSGMFRPFERYTLGFEAAGRIEAFGEASGGKPLDEGDVVAAGQVLAKLDDRVLRARLKEASARLEQAQSNLRRGQEVKERFGKAVTETELQDLATQLALAEAQRDMAEKNLRDATLVSPANAVVSRRPVNVGESVNSHQTIFELVEVDRLLLMAGVPESRVREIRAGQPVHLTLMSRDVRGQQPPSLTGEVYRVSQTADDRTGLFEVEIVVPNPDGALRPGLVATAQIVIEHFEGFRLPIAAAVFRDGEASLYTVEPAKVQGDAAAKSAAGGVARQLRLERWIEQGPDLLLQELPAAHRTVVIRGQHRLIDGAPVEIVATSAASNTALRRPAAKPPAVQTATRGPSGEEG